MIALVIDENLRLILKPSKGSAVYDPIAVALEGRSKIVLGLRVAASSRLKAACGVGRENFRLCIFEESSIGHGSLCSFEAIVGRPRVSKPVKEKVLDPIARPTPFRAYDRRESGLPNWAIFQSGSLRLVDNFMEKPWICHLVPSMSHSVKYL